MWPNILKNDEKSEFTILIRAVVRDAPLADAVEGLGLVAGQVILGLGLGILGQVLCLALPVHKSVLPRLQQAAISKTPRHLAK